MMNNKWCVSCGILTIGLIPALSGTASARDVELRIASVLDDDAAYGGEMSSGPGATGQNGDVVYRMQRPSGYFFPAGCFISPLPRDYDDIHAERGGELIEYSIDVFGSTFTGCNAGNPADVRTALYLDSAGDPAIGAPDAEIPGTECFFIGIPAGSVFRLTCKVRAGVIIPDAFWIAFQALGLSDNIGWLIADCDAVSNPDIGFSDDVWVNEYIPDSGGFGFFFFGGCNCDPNNFHPCASMLVRVVVQGKGACCDIATGVCTSTIERLCQGFTETFTAGGVCPTGGPNPNQVTCDVPDNVPTVTQWGMVVLTVAMLTGLTIKFGRRRTAIA